MAYEFKFRLEKAPQAVINGSGKILHEVVVVYRLEGSNVDWQNAPQVPSHYARVYIPAADITVVMDMPHGTGQEKVAKANAYRQLIQDNRTTKCIPYDTNWQTAGLENFMVNNTAVVTEATRADRFIRIVMGKTYPVAFS